MTSFLIKMTTTEAQKLKKNNNNQVITLKFILLLPYEK